MLQALRLTFRGWLPHSASEAVQVATLPARHTSASHDLEYKDINNAMVITERNTFGHEMPVAIAFVAESGRVTIGYIAELAEI